MSHTHLNLCSDLDATVSRKIKHWNFSCTTTKFCVVMKLLGLFDLI